MDNNYNFPFRAEEWLGTRNRNLCTSCRYELSQEKWYRHPDICAECDEIYSDWSLPPIYEREYKYTRILIKDLNRF